MQAGAVASLIGIGVDFIGISSVKTRIANANHKLSAAQVTNAEHVAVAYFIIQGLLSVVFWIWLSRVNSQGKSWGRIVSTVLFALDTILQFVGLAGGLSPAGRIFAIVVWLIGLVTIIMLWQRSSSEYFSSAAQQYQ